MTTTATASRAWARLRERVGQTARDKGFLHAWQQHLLEMVRHHRAAGDAGASLESALAEWVRKDPQLAECHDALPTGPFPQPIDRMQREEVGHSVAFDEIREADGSPMACVFDETFQNWGRTVANKPYLTCLPKTKLGVCNLVKWAARHRKAVRAAGYRHTWSDCYTSDGQVLVSLLPLADVYQMPVLKEPELDPYNQLQGIQIVGTIQEGSVTKALCKIGAATTNEQFRRWCLDEEGGAWKWTIPLNVIMVEITWGGSNAPICHGAGLRNQTLSDLVTEIEFVNAKGELQVVSDPEQLRCAAGCFGLLGIVTSITLKLDPMTYASMTPVKRRVALTIPPPKGFRVPAAIDMSGITQRDLDEAWEDFVARCENDYYSEWFWFPYQSKCWINTWKNDGRKEDAEDYLGVWGTWSEQMQEYLAEVMNTTVFQCVPGILQAEALGFGAMSALPDKHTVVAPLIEALHFRRGIQNMRVRDMELEIPIPPRADDPTKPDWSVCQRAWWAVLSNIYARNDAPMRIALEMRIMADSNVIMAPQFGNRLGTCSIEVLTTPNVDAADWLGFMQEIADAWDAETDPAGRRLNVRTHWAKQWQGLSFRGMTVNEYLKNVAYKERLPEFRAGLRSIAEAGGYTLSDLQRMFSNPLLDDIFEEVFDEADAG